MIKVNWETDIPSGTELLNYEDLNVKDEQEWNALTKEQQTERLQEYLDALPERNCIVVTTYCSLT